MSIFIFLTTFGDGLFTMPFCSWVTSTSLFQTSSFLYFYAYVSIVFSCSFHYQIVALQKAFVKIKKSLYFSFYEKYKPFYSYSLSEMSFNSKRITFLRSSDATSTWYPIFPALKIIVFQSAAVSSIVVVKNFFIPIGEHPP